MTNNIRPDVPDRVEAAIDAVQGGVGVDEALNDLLSGVPVEEMAVGGDGDDGPMDGDDGDGEED